jgi:hypothetical protein
MGRLPNVGLTTDLRLRNLPDRSPPVQAEKIG